MSNRIYGTRTDINEQEVRDFYNKRAALASSMKNPLSAVVNGEQNPEQADTRSRFDREYIVPRLDLTQNSAVLDIGCGMGRFAEMVLLMRKVSGRRFRSGDDRRRRKKNGSI